MSRDQAWADYGSTGQTRSKKQKMRAANVLGVGCTSKASLARTAVHTPPKLMQVDESSAKSESSSLSSIMYGCRFQIKTMPRVRSLMQSN
jgi:hypothetical protein